MTPEELQAFRSGDPTLFRALVERLSPRLLGLATAFVQDVDVAHDVVQETWVRAFERRHQFRGDGSLLAWLMTICKSRAIERGRRAELRAREPVPAGGLEPPGFPTPEEELDRATTRSAVLRAIDGLPRRQRDTVVLRVLEGRNTAETAEALGCAEGTVKAALHAALKNLTPKLKDL